jgi:hypothetical protein
MLNPVKSCWTFQCLMVWSFFSLYISQFLMVMYHDVSCYIPTIPPWNDAVHPKKEQVPFCPGWTHWLQRCLAGHGSSGEAKGEASSSGVYINNGLSSWLVDGLEHDILGNIGNNHPNWLITNIFQRGRSTTNQMGNLGIFGHYIE